MHRVWIIIFLLISACFSSDDSIKEDDLIIIGDKFFIDLPTNKYARIYGYMSKKDQGIVLFPNKGIAKFNSRLSQDVSARIWLPENALGESCYENYVVIKAKKFYYVGVASLDEVLVVENMENDEVCYINHEPINYFSRASSQVSTGQ